MAKCHFRIETWPLVSRTITIIVSHTIRIVIHKKNYSVDTLQLRASTRNEIGVPRDKLSFANQFTRVLVYLTLSVNSLPKWRHRSDLFFLYGQSCFANIIIKVSKNIQLDILFRRILLYNLFNFCAIFFYFYTIPFIPKQFSNPHPMLKYVKYLFYLLFFFFVLLQYIYIYNLYKYNNIDNYILQIYKPVFRIRFSNN